jgi:hypothetical protein
MSASALNSSALALAKRKTRQGRGASTSRPLQQQQPGPDSSRLAEPPDPPSSQHRGLSTQPHYDRLVIYLPYNNLYVPHSLFTFLPHTHTFYTCPLYSGHSLFHSLFLIPPSLLSSFNPRHHYINHLQCPFPWIFLAFKVASVEYELPSLHTTPRLCHHESLQRVL